MAGVATPKFEILGAFRPKSEIENSRKKAYQKEWYNGRTHAKRESGSAYLLGFVDAK
jgi:hypothetical protein